MATGMTKQCKDFALELGTEFLQEEIENRQIQKSRREAANILYQHLTRMDNWWPQLLEGLRSTRQDKLAAMLSGKYECSNINDVHAFQLIK